MVDILKPISIVMDNGQAFAGLLSLTQDEDAVLIGEGAPAITPNYEGQGYLSRVNKQFYTANNLGQWVPLSVSTSYTGSLNALTDLQLTSPSNGQTITYNFSLSKWVNTTPSASSAGATILNELLDVVVPNPIQNDSLYFDGLNWINRELNLDLNYDVFTNNPTLNDTLYHTGSRWENTPLTLDLLKDVQVGGSSSSSETGQVLKYVTNKWTNKAETYIDLRSTSLDVPQSYTSSTYQLTSLSVFVPSFNNSVTKVKVTVSGMIGMASAGNAYLSIDHDGVDVKPVGTTGLGCFGVDGGSSMRNFSIHYVGPSTGGTYTFTIHGAGVEVFLGRRGASDSIIVPTLMTVDIYSA